jgi:hypothetical protein
LRDIESLLKMALPVTAVPQFEIRPGTGAAEPARERASAGAHRQGQRPQGSWQPKRHTGGRTHGARPQGGYSRARRSV